MLTHSRSSAGGHVVVIVLPSLLTVSGAGASAGRVWPMGEEDNRAEQRFVLRQNGGGHFLLSESPSASEGRTNDIDSNSLAC